MSRKRVRLIAAIVILLLLLGLIGAAYLNYRSTRKLGLTFAFNQQELLPMPQYLYSFSGEGKSRLIRPLGVLVDGNRVYVTDSRRASVDVFTDAGDYVTSWGKGKVLIPLYVAKNPITGQFWVTDRRLRAIVIFDANGKFVRQFDPKLPKGELPKFDTKGFQWAPVALAFAPDGTLYVTEILNGHRLMIFDADGTFRRSVGTAGLVNDAKAGEAVFQFPNSVKVQGGEVWVADSNNRRIQVFNREGEFKRFVVTEGLPRGFDFLPKLKDKEPRRVVVVDTLSHDATIWNADKAEKILTFGEHGVLEGQFAYPNDTSINAKRKMFIADTSNGRIQVWGWPATANPVPTPQTPTQWGLCLAPLVLLPLLLLLRRRRHYATADFVMALYELGEIDRMPHPRVRWEVTQEDYETLSALEPQNGIALGELLHAVEHSDSDAHALQERYELEYRDAVAMSLAQRSKLFGTESPELRRVARVLEVSVVDHLEFIARTPKKPARGETQPPAED